MVNGIKRRTKVEWYQKCQLARVSQSKAYGCELFDPTIYLSPFSKIIVKNYWPRSRMVQGQPRPSCQLITHVWFSIRLPLTPSSHLSPFSKYLMSDFNDLEVDGSRLSEEFGVNDKRVICGTFSIVVRKLFPHFTSTLQYIYWITTKYRQRPIITEVCDFAIYVVRKYTAFRHVHTDGRKQAAVKRTWDILPSYFTRQSSTAH